MMLLGFLQAVALLEYCLLAFLVGVYGKIRILKLQDELGADDSFREQKQMFWTVLVYLAGALGMAYSLFAVVAILAGLFGLGYGERVYPRIKEEIQARLDAEVYRNMEEAKEFLEQTRPHQTKRGLFR